ncbi:Lysocardiolipin acyltransferase 1 [Chelonia mydas]|uniref:Lysocardiolipin acyltransferase 1 n=1 Tax=Chelonia mydas TaxID=8469 RepID=M7AP34_CHEMY|nr:Lysocardiolipin acyltransferase 1 [Chelonia mydas]
MESALTPALGTVVSVHGNLPVQSTSQHRSPSTGHAKKARKAPSSQRHRGKPRGSQMPDIAEFEIITPLVRCTCNNLDAIHDITVAYPQNIPQTEKHLLNGNFPKEIHFHVHRYPVQTLPTSREELQLWCQKRWEEKEERLQLFYEGEKYFDVTGRSIIPPCKSELRVLVVKCISLLYWTLFTLGLRHQNCQETAVAWKRMLAISIQISILFQITRHGPFLQQLLKLLFIFKPLGYRRATFIVRLRTLQLCVSDRRNCGSTRVRKEGEIVRLRTLQLCVSDRRNCGLSTGR